MRRALAAAALLAVAILLSGCGAGQPGKSGGMGLKARAFTAGAVEVTIQPLTIDAAGASFKLTLNTHSTELSADLAKTSHLEVSGREWAEATWVGDGPGGHHREGELRFQPGGPATGDVRVTIGGLPTPVAATWSLPPIR